MFRANIIVYAMSFLLIFVVSQSFFACKTLDTASQDVVSLFPDEQRRIKIFDEITPSVVYIKSKKIHPIKQAITYCSGSGYVVSYNKQKFIVTNNHLVELAYSVWITIDGKEWKAKSIDAIPSRDIAVIAIEQLALSKAKPIKFGKSSDLKVGQSVYVVGHPFGLPLTMTQGIISGLNRKIHVRNELYIHGCIQVDSAVNPGNSGGVLLNSHGELIGMPTSLISRGGDFCGVAFAIPSDLIKETVALIMEQREGMAKFLNKTLDYSE